MKESALQEKILGYLRSRSKEGRGYWIKIHVASLQLEGEPDIVGCYRGKFCAFELKAPKTGRATALQLYKLDLLRKAGAISMVVTDLKTIVEVLDAIDNSLEKGDAYD